MSPRKSTTGRSWRCSLGHLHFTERRALLCDAYLHKRRERRLRCRALEQVPIPFPEATR